MGERIVREGDLSSHSMKEKTKYVGCENYFDFISEPPTLLNISSVSIAIALWTGAGMKKLMEDHRQNYTNLHLELEYCRLEERALKNVKELLLPKELKLNITHCMMPIGLQLQQSFDHRKKKCCRFNDVHKKGGSLYWTMEGVIDQAKSLKELIDNNVKKENMDYLYKLACKYCLEEIVLDLWEKIPSAQNILVDDVSKHYHNHILAYWTAVQKNELSSLLTKIMPYDNNQIYSSDLSIYENMILLSIFLGNLFALKYFWEKLSDHEKYVNIENWVINLTEKIKCQKYVNYQTYDVYVEMLWFLLAQVNDLEKQIEIFHVHSKMLLRSLLFYWPFQRFFLPAMIKMMDLIHIDIYASIMKALVLQIKDGRLTGEQFRTIWHHSPVKFQDHFLLVLNRGSKAKLFVVSALLLAGDIQTICVILKNDFEEERKTLVTNLIQYDLKRLIQSNKLIFADALLSKLLSDCDISIFKQHIMMTYANEFCCDSIRKLNYNAAEQLLNWGFQSYGEIQDFKRNKLNSNEIFISLILLGDFDYVERFVKWCFESETEVSQFKKAFISDDNIFYFEKLLFRLSSLDEDGWNIFEEKFINYFSCTAEKVTILKKLLLKEVGHIVEAHNLKFASLLLNWCLGSIDEANQFKNELLLSRRGIDTVLGALREIQVSSKIIRVLKWFSPLSSEVIAKLKYTLTTKKFRSDCRISQEKQKQALFYLLDFFVANYNEHDFDSNKEYELNLNNILLGFKPLNCPQSRRFWIP